MKTSNTNKIKAQKYLIKFHEELDGPDAQPAAYWNQDDESWVDNPANATSYSKDDGIKEVGRLHIEEEWILTLIRFEDAKYTPPQKCVECDGELGRGDNKNSHSNPRTCIKELKSRLTK